MTEQSPNKKDLEGLIEKYAWHIIDGLDHKDADQMLLICYHESMKSIHGMRSLKRS